MPKDDAGFTHQHAMEIGRTRDRVDVRLLVLVRLGLEGRAGLGSKSVVL